MLFLLLACMSSFGSYFIHVSCFMFHISCIHISVMYVCIYILAQMKMMTIIFIADKENCECEWADEKSSGIFFHRMNIIQYRFRIISNSECIHTIQGDLTHIIFGLMFCGAPSTPPPTPFDTNINSQCDLSKISVTFAIYISRFTSWISNDFDRSTVKCWSECNTLHRIEQSP